MSPSGLLKRASIALTIHSWTHLATFFSMFEDPEYDWCMYTAPQEANHGKVHHVPRRKLLGGSSGINYMMYVRGSLQDYDDWAALTGDDGWSAEEMQHYMRKHQVCRFLV